MKDEELLSKTINYLRFPLIVGVVFIHFNLTDGFNIHGVTYGLENPDWFFFIVIFISEVWGHISVPLFFIISGFLFFYHKSFDRNIYQKQIRSRIKTLLIPYLLWNLIAIVFKLKCFLPVISSFYRPLEIQISFTRIFNTFFCNSNTNGILISPYVSLSGLYPINTPLWFVRDLMVMVILSPIIYYVIKKAGQWFILAVGLAWFFSSIILPEGNSFWEYIEMLLTATFFFSWGAFYSINHDSFVRCFRKISYAPLFYFPLAVVDALTKGLVFYIHHAGILVGVVSVVVVVSLLLQSNKVKVNDILANSSFFIYALHILFIGDVGKLAFTLLHIPGNNPYAMLAFYFCVPIFTILVCLFLYLFLKRYALNVCNILTGGR